MQQILAGYPGFQTLLRVYERLRAKYPDGEVPFKSDLQPRDLVALLPQLSITERVAEDDIRVILTGTGLDRSFSKNLTGTNVMEYYSPKERKIMQAFHGGIVEGPYGGISLVNLTLTDRSLNNCASLYLPLRGGDGAVKYYLTMNQLAPLDRDQTDDIDPQDQAFKAKVKRASLFNLFDGPKYSVVKKLA